MEHIPISQKDTTVTGKKRPMAAFFCSYTPQEIIAASGFQPQRIIPSGYDPALANSFLDSNFCPLVRSILSWVIKQNHKKNLGPVILVNSCDGMRRLYDVMKYYFKDPFIYFLDLPRKRDRSSEELFKSHLYDLKNSLEKYTGKVITDKDLQRSIKESNKLRIMAARLAEMRQQEKITLSYYDLLKLIQDGNPAMKSIYQSYFVSGLLNKDSSIKARYKKAQEKKNSLSILLTGTVLDNFEIIKVIEEYGGFIEIADHCNGWRYYFNQMEENNPDIIGSIAHFYLHKISCPRMLESVEREEKLLEIIKTRKIDGVIFYTQKFCDNTLLQIPLLSDKIKMLGVSLLYLEGEFSSHLSGQTKTRIQAFMEALEFER